MQFERMWLSWAKMQRNIVMIIFVVIPAQAGT
jgi:hypothetical protein